MSTLNHDAADLPEASCQPEEIKESPAEVLQSMFARAASRGLLKEVHHGICGLLINQYFTELADGNIEQENGAPEAFSELVEILMRFTEYENPAAYAYAYLIILDRCPFSETAIAKKLGVTRSYISKVKTEIQDRLGMKCRLGRSDESRKATTERRRSEPPRKKICQRQKSNLELRTMFSTLFAQVT